VKIHGYELTKEISIHQNALKISISGEEKLLIYTFSGDEVFCGDYWNSVYIDELIFDLNLYFDEEVFRLTLYPVIDNFADYSTYFRL
jgi:hypothetical protein